MTSTAARSHASVGAELRLPDFIVGGAPRCATTWLATLLDRHPGVSMASPMRPEPKFFLLDDEYEQGLSYYSQRWFSSVPKGVLAGEKSTNYLESAQAAARIRRDLPEVRLVFCLRDPVARALSNYRWSVDNGLETMSLRDALDAEPRREASYPCDHRHSRPHSYFSRGLYATHLRPYLEAFARSQILILRFEDLAARPCEMTERLHRFLGLRPCPRHAVGLAPLNGSSHVDGSEEVAATIAWLRDRYRRPNQELASLLGAEFSWESA